MKIILSRKGFDGESGGYPSPILPNGRLLSLPVPSRGCDNSYADICRKVGLPAKLVEQLTRGRFKASRRAHLDPDLRKEALPGKRGWRGLYGAGGGRGSGAAILRSQGVGAGDMFLFYGWFRRTTLENGKVRYDRSAPEVHALFGWLQVDKALDAKKTKRNLPKHLRWADYFDHFYDESGTVYVARKYLKLPGLARHVPGYGVFDAFRQELQLTAPKRYQRDGWHKSLWALPEWCRPRNGKYPLTFHEKPELWKRKSKCVILQSAARGQEFVLDAKDYPEAERWARKLIEGGFGDVVGRLW